MGFFSKNEHENNGFIINTDDEPIKISGDKNLAPHAMTADEVSNLWLFENDEPDFTKSNALDSLKKRMNVSESPKPESKKIELNTPTPKVTPDKKEKSEVFKPTPVAESNTAAVDNKSLVEKVKRYTIDEHGHDVTTDKKPLYELESVAEILMSNGENAMKNLSEKYGVDFVFDDLGKTKEKLKQQPNPTQQERTKPKSQKQNADITPTPAFEKMVNDAEARESRELYENLFADKKAIDPPDISVPDISDIDTKEVGITNETPISNTSTIRFTPVKNKKGNTDHIAVSSITKYVDLGETEFEDILSQSTSQTLEQSEFEKFVPQSEITNLTDGKKFLHKLALKKRSCFFGALFSALSVIALAVFLIPPVYDFIIGNPKNAMYICSAFLLISVFANASMFLDFKNLFKKRCGFDILVAFCSVLTLVFGIVAAQTLSNAYYSILICSIILFTRSICRFKEISATASNLKQIINENPKKALSFISDPATTFAMAKNTIEGDVLAVSYRKTNFVSDFVKHNDYLPKLSGKSSLVFYCTLFFCIFSGIIAFFYYQSIFEAFYSATVIASIVSMPSIFFINTLPLSSAAKKLNPKGSMIAGLYGAERIELANAVTVNINDIFPTGSIKMYSMKVLSDNNIDDTLLRAASLTAAINSPLCAIFEQIAGTNTSYSIPDSDTVKYEKNLGISGWVNNELLFIGNRSFMQAHGIAIPSLEIDKKILRKGYFPVYVANTDTACALIVINYDVKPEVAKELRKITDLGLTLLVENCDPNVTEEMLCDYFGLYENSVKIMTNSGVYMLKNATPAVDECCAPAAYKGSDLNLIRIVNCASRIKRSNSLLTVMYTIFCIIGVMGFIYTAFSGLTSMPSSLTVLIFELATAIISIIGFLIRKP